MLKFVRPYLIYLEEWQITEYCKNHLNNFDFLPQNLRQYHFHDVSKYEKKFTEGKYKIILRSLGQNEKYICLSLEEILLW